MFGNVTALEGLHVIREIQGNRARWRLAFGIRHGILTEGGLMSEVPLNLNFVHEGVIAIRNHRRGYCFTMTTMVQVCSNFIEPESITNTRPDEVIAVRNRRRGGACRE